MCSEGYRSWFVCLSVCVFVFRRLLWHYRLRGSLLAIPAASELCDTDKKEDDFPETTAVERYPVKKAHMHNRLDLPRPDPLALCTLGAQEVTTNAMYRLPLAIYYGS